MAASTVAPPEAMPNRQFARLLIESSFTHLWLFIQFFFHISFFPTENWISATWWISFNFFSLLFLLSFFCPNKNKSNFLYFVRMYLSHTNLHKQISLWGEKRIITWKVCVRQSCNYYIGSCCVQLGATYSWHNISSTLRMKKKNMFPCNQKWCSTVTWKFVW